MYKRDIFNRSRYILAVWKHFLYFEFFSVLFLQNTSTYFYLNAESEKGGGRQVRRIDLLSLKQRLLYGRSNGVSFGITYSMIVGYEILISVCNMHIYQLYTFVVKTN